MSRSWRSSASTGERAERWLAVLDTSVLVSAVVSTHRNSGSRRTVEAAISGIYDCVLSDFIRNECLEILALPRVGSNAPEIVDEKFRPLWKRAIWVELAEDSEDLRAVVSDEADIPILRTAKAVFEIPDLAARNSKFLVSNNSRHFPPGRNWYGFEFLTAHEFHRRLTGSR